MFDSVETRHIDEKLVIPSSDDSEDEELPDEDKEDELLFSKMLKDKLENRLRNGKLEHSHVCDDLYPNDDDDVEMDDGEEEVNGGSREEAGEDIGEDEFEEVNLPNFVNNKSDKDLLKDPDYVPERRKSSRRRRGRPRRQARNEETADHGVESDGPRQGGRPPPSSESVWRKVPFVPPVMDWEDNMPDPPVNSENLSPLDYFKMFIGDGLIESITEESNTYAHKTSGIAPNFTAAEIKQFIGILLYTGIVRMPQYRMYWSSETRFAPVADTMSRTRFEQLLRYFHIVDNDKKVPGDKLFKVRPLLDEIVEKCRAVPNEQKHSVDELMIPFKGLSQLKQYVKAKPKKWGYKVFVRCGASGILHDFKIYVGAGTCENYKLGFSGDIVMELCRHLPEHTFHEIYCDSWFSSVQLFRALKDKGVWATGTIRADRTNKAPLMEEKALKDKKRGFFDVAVDTKNGLAAVRWFDNKAITLLSSFVASEPIGKCKRWSKKDRTRMEIPRPAIVQSYNESMGGVDLCGMLIALYRIHVKSKRGYMRIVHWCFNLAVVNGWLLYRRHKKQNDTKFDYTLIRFQAYIAKALCTAGKEIGKRRVGRPKLPRVPITPKRGRKRILPVAEVRFDCKGHWPFPRDKKARCALCKSGYSRTTCRKCNISLCLTKDKNCFYDFHCP